MRRCCGEFPLGGAELPVALGRNEANKEASTEENCAVAAQFTTATPPKFPLTLGHPKDEKEAADVDA